MLISDNMSRQSQTANQMSVAGLQVLQRTLYTSCLRSDKEKSKVEQTVSALKESLKAKKEPGSSASTLTTPIDAVDASKKTIAVSVVPKKSIRQRVVEEIMHYYHGFRLLFIDIHVSAKLVWSILNGNSLTRREHRMLVRTVSDIFRLVPFSVFIIVPFMEFLLPFFIKFFPGMLPSTFQSASDKEKKMKSSLKVKLETAKFLQDTLDEMAVQRKGDKKSETAREFSTFFEKIRSSGEQASNEDIIRFSKLFEDDITLDSLNRPQLMALCKLLELQPLGPTPFLRFQLRTRLRSLIADDKIIMKEGIANLNTLELQQACKARGMRAFGVSNERLLSQLEQWLELSLNEKIPPSLLLLSRALYIPETLPATDKLKATILTLPDSVAIQARAKIGEMEGKVDNKTKIAVIRDEQRQIQEEKDERQEREKLAVTAKVPTAADVDLTKTVQHGLEAVQFSSEDLVDRAPILVDTAQVGKSDDKVTEGDVITNEDLDVIEDALENISSEKKKLLIEKEELQDLKEDMEDYKEDMEELKDVVVLSGLSEKDIKISKASKRLYKMVNRMVDNMDHIITDIELKSAFDVGNKDETKHKEALVTIDELVQAIRKLKNSPNASRLEKIADVLEEIDNDQDGVVKVEDVLQMIELIGKDDIELSNKQLTEIVSLLEKEETLEFLERIDHVLKREEQHKIAEETKSGERIEGTVKK